MAENKKLITADNSFLTYMGRIDFSDKTRPEFYYAGSNVKMTFTGTSVSPASGTAGAGRCPG